jgi:hypothetical protein
MLMGDMHAIQRGASRHPSPRINGRGARPGARCDDREGSAILRHDGNTRYVD